jgi:hypothetical protein
LFGGAINRQLEPSNVLRFAAGLDDDRVADYLGRSQFGVRVSADDDVDLRQRGSDALIGIKPACERTMMTSDLLLTSGKFVSAHQVRQ